MEQSDPKHLLIQVAKILERLNIPYFITGGIAVVVWGRPRFTADIDIVVELKKENIDSLERALKEISKVGYIDRQMIDAALETKGEFNFIDGESGMRVDFWVAKDDEFSRERFKRRILKNIGGQDIYFISPEDLILIKLLWNKDSGSSRQLEDIESIFKISRENLDMQYLDQWAKKLGVSETFTKLLEK